MYAIINGKKTEFLGTVSTAGTIGAMYLECNTSEIMSHIQTTSSTGYQIVRIQADKNAYSSDDATVTIHFDHTSTAPIDHVRVFLTTNLGNRLTNASIYSHMNTQSMSVQIPFSTIRSTVENIYGTTVNASFGIEVSLWSGGTEYKVSSDSVMPRVRINTAPATVFDLSTNKDPEIAKKENVILSQIAANFPVENPSDYRWDLGSGFHDDSEVYAADFNAKTGGDTDRGNIVRAVADGVLDLSNWGYAGGEIKQLNEGAIIIKHNSTSSTGSINWTSGYLHTPIENSGEKRIVEVMINGILTTAERVIYKVHKQKITQ